MWKVSVPQRVEEGSMITGPTVFHLEVDVAWSNNTLLLQCEISGKANFILNNIQIKARTASITKKP